MQEYKLRKKVLNYTFKMKYLLHFAVLLSLLVQAPVFHDLQAIGEFWLSCAFVMFAVNWFVLQSRYRYGNCTNQSWVQFIKLDAAAWRRGARSYLYQHPPGNCLAICVITELTVITAGSTHVRISWIYCATEWLLWGQCSSLREVISLLGYYKLSGSRSAISVHIYAKICITSLAGTGGFCDGTGHDRLKTRAKFNRLEACFPIYCRRG